MSPRVINGNLHPTDAAKLVDDMFAGRWQNPIYRQFQEQAEAAGYEVNEYHGRYFYYGPAVWLDNQDQYHDFIRAINTDIRLQCDDCGKTGKIVYPK